MNHGEHGEHGDFYVKDIVIGLNQFSLRALRVLRGFTLVRSHVPGF